MAACERDPVSESITLLTWRMATQRSDPSVDRLIGYSNCGVERRVVRPPSMGRHDAAATPRHLDKYNALGSVDA